MKFQFAKIWLGIFRFRGKLAVKPFRAEGSLDLEQRGVRIEIA